MLKEDDESILIYGIENGIDYLQMFEFIFNDKINHVWKASDVLKVIFDIFGFFSIGAYLGATITFGLYLVAFYLVIIGIILTVIDIIYVSYSFRRKRFSVTWPLTVLRNVVALSVTVFFLPITEFLIGMLECG